MARGGKRNGAGRPKGALSTRTQEIAAAALADGVTPLDVLLGTMRALWARAERGDELDLESAVQACAVAKDAAPYLHPRLQALEHTGKDGGPIETKDATPQETVRRLAFLLQRGAADAETTTGASA